jgi:hypothetical protein
MTQRCEYVVDDRAVQAARLIGLSGDVEKRLLRMVRRSAPLTHELGNRRFDDFVLFVQDKVVLDVNRLG